LVTESAARVSSVLAAYVVLSLLRMVLKLI